jgi:hypothetical protein
VHDRSRLAPVRTRLEAGPRAGPGRGGPDPGGGAGVQAAAQAPGVTVGAAGVAGVAGPEPRGAGPP